MGKPKRHTSIRDMSAPPPNRKRKQSKPPTYYGGPAGRGAPIVEVPPVERDWFAEGRCANCHRETPKKILTRHVALDDRARCKSCHDRLPSHLRQLPTRRTRKPKRETGDGPTHNQIVKARKAESRVIMASIPGTSMDEKLDSIQRGLATEDPKWIWDPKTKRKQSLYGPDPEPVVPEPEPVETWACGEEECRFQGDLDAVHRHSRRTNHLLRHRLEVE